MRRVATLTVAVNTAANEGGYAEAALARPDVWRGGRGGAFLSVTPIRFPVRVGFHARVKQRVHQYFADNRLAKTGDWRLFLKTGLILLWFGLCYLLYVFWATSLLMSLFTVVGLAQGFILIGFNLMHDGGHNSYSRQKTVNWLVAFTLDVIGGSHVLRRPRASLLPLAYPNMYALGSALETAGLCRSSPE